MTATRTPYRSTQRPGRDGFGRLVRAEWTKFRTVRGWVAGALVAVVVTVLVSVLDTGGGSVRCRDTDPGACAAAHTPPLGPDGTAVTDHFAFAHQPLTGDGTITVRVTSLTGQRSPLGGTPDAPDAPDARSGTEPWTKAGILVKADTEQGSSYAAIMVTGDHGVRMQYDFTHDQAGPAGAVSAESPRWLRLTRAGDTITGSASSDGTSWREVGTVTLTGLPSTVPAGMFVTSPEHTDVTRSFGGLSGESVTTQATAEFDRIDLSGGWSGGGWTVAEIGGPPDAEPGQPTDDGFRLTGTGDIAPIPAGPPNGRTVEHSLIGAFAGLIALVIVAAVFMTGEYRRGLIRTTFAASPARGRVLAAKAVVIAAVTFVVGLVAAELAYLLVGRIERGKNVFVLPVSTLTEVRVVVGTAALLAVAAVLALAIGTLLRRGTAAVTAVIVAIVLPYVLSVAYVLPPSAANWLLRLTPAAGFAIQQSVPPYPQVSAPYAPDTGYFPLPPWGGFAVLCGYAIVGLVLAGYALRRRDA